MNVGTAVAPDSLGYFHIRQKLLFCCGHIVKAVAILVTALIPLLLALVMKDSVYGTPSGKGWVKPAERTCARSGSRTLHLFVVFFILAIPFVGTTQQ